MEITTKQLDHHGLVAGTFDKFGMGEVIEKRIPKGRNCNLSTSTIIKAMIIFLKDKSFGVNDVYLKKPGRIEALVMIMVLTLLVYSLAEWEIRNRLRETGQTFPNQLKKPTNRPTFKWVCQNFMNITVVSVITDRQETKQIANLKDLQIKVIKLLGEEYEKYYF